MIRSKIERFILSQRKPINHPNRLFIITVIIALFMAMILFY